MSTEEPKPETVGQRTEARALPTLGGSLIPATMLSATLAVDARTESRGSGVTAAAVNRKWPKQGSTRRSTPQRWRRKRIEHEMGKISFEELFVIRHVAVILVDTGGIIVISLNSTVWELRRYSAYQKYGRRTGR